MSYSMDFCKKRFRDLYAGVETGRNMDNAYETDAESVFDTILNGARKIQISSFENFVYEIHLHFDKDAKFQYYTSESCIHDGTLIFVLETISRCAEKVCTGGTFYKPLGTVPNGGEAHFTIGDFVVLNEIDENGDRFTPKSRKWMNARTTVWLPLKMEYKSN